MKYDYNDVRNLVREAIIDSASEGMMADAVLDVISGYDFEEMIRNCLRDKMADKLYSYVESFVEENVDDWIDGYLEEVFG